jgi:CubicO group peptidase (beta-lactamase class C family)
MRFLKFLHLPLLFSLMAISATAADVSAPLSASLDIDLIMQRAAERGLIAGSVVVIGNRDGILFHRAYGKTSHEPGAPPMTVDTVFDLASLTKVIATTPAVMKLAEEGRVSLVDSATRFFPEFAGEDKKEMLVMNLLTHTTGFDDFQVPSVDPAKGVVDRAASERVKGGVGHRFRYADVNFILLGELVRRVTGTGLDRYTAENFYRPLGMTDTAFNPALAIKSRCAPTIGDRVLTGEVQDGNARLLNGVAGHAGLFSTGRDLSVFCRMILGEGKVDGRRVLSERTVRQMTAPYFSRGGSVIRGLGWDMVSPYASPRGRGFSELSFGHTGYSGSSIWIDPDNNLFVILLTSRLDYRHVSDFNRLRNDLSTIAASIYAPGAASDPFPLSIP